MNIKKHISLQQVIALVLIIIALVIFNHAIFVVQIPQTSWSKSSDVGIISKDGIPITFSLILHFSTLGSFSAENPVHVNATITNANVSDLMSHIGAITFTNAFNADYETNLNIDNVVVYGYIPLSQSGEGKYVADGDLIWHQTETCYLIALPPFQDALKSVNLEQQNLGEEPFLFISPVSDILSIRSNHTIEQLTYVLLGFSVIMLHSVFSSLIPDKATKKK